jgi:hypothetical protein
MTSFDASDLHNLGIIVTQAQWLNGATHCFIQTFWHSGNYYSKKLIKSYSDLCSFRRKLIRVMGKCQCQSSKCGFSSAATTHLKAKDLKYMNMVGLFGSMSDQNVKACAFLNALVATLQTKMYRHHAWSNSCQFLQLVAHFLLMQKKPRVLAIGNLLLAGWQQNRSKQMPRCLQTI